MASKLRASTLSADKFHCRAQPIRADFINSKKLPARLDRLLGQGKYECHWQLNHYIIDGPRPLTDVSTGWMTLFSRAACQNLQVLCCGETPLLTPFTG
jgi:hypothetical protein